MLISQIFFVVHLFFTFPALLQPLQSFLCFPITFSMSLHITVIRALKRFSHNRTTSIKGNGNGYIKMLRRQFFKLVGGLGSVAAASLAAPTTTLSEKGDRSVIYGYSPCDMPGPGYTVYISNYVGWPCIWDFWDCSVLVTTTRPIKKGERLCWHPNGTISGA